jgi:hypothetical protein
MSTKTLEQSSRQFAAIIVLMMVFLLCVLAWEFTGIFRQASAGAVFLLAQTFYWIPAFFYLWALWAIRLTFREIGAGVAFGPAVARGLRRVGLANLIGGGINLLIVPFLKMARADNAQQFELLASLDFDDALMWAYLMLVLLGISLLLLSRLITRAARYESESKEFF